MKMTQRILIIAVVALTVVLLVVFANMAGQVEYTSLFTGLTDEEAGQVLAALEEQGVPVKTGPNGTLLVPADQAQELRYRLTTEGLPGTDDLDFTLYSENASSFGATDQDKTFYEQAQLQRNLALTINRMDKIKSSTVLLALAEDSPYVLTGDQPADSTASILVTLKDPSEPLTESDVAAIRSMVSKAVPSLAADNISIVDQNMRSYGVDGENGTTTLEEQFNLQREVSKTLEQQVITLLTPVFGPENISASVNVILDFDKTTTNTLTLSPPTNQAENMGIITSMRLTAERLQGANSVAEGEPGMDPNGGAPTYQEIDDAAGDSTYYNAVTEVNAEVNEVSEQIENAQGDITDISCTVILNGGEELEDILPEVQSQVATAIGVPLNMITVSAMPFEQNAQYEQYLADQQAEAERLRQREMIMTLAVPLIIAAGLIIGVLLVIGYLRRKKREADEEAARLEAERLAEEERARAEAEAEARREAGIVDIEIGDETEEEDLSGMLKDRNETLMNVRKLVEEDSAAIAQLLRNWLSDATSE